MPTSRATIYLVLLAFMGVAAPAAAQSEYDYTLDFELDSRTGRYRPAYTHKSSKGNATIWLDRGGKKDKGKGKVDRSPGPDDERVFVSCEWPAGWKVQKTEEKAKAAHTDGTSFTVFASRAASGSGKKDIVDEWNARARSRHGAMAEGEIQTGEFKNSGTYALYAKADARSVVAMAVIYSEKRALPILFEFTDTDAFQARRGEFRAFLESIQLKRGKLGASK